MRKIVIKERMFEEMSTEQVITCDKCGKKSVIKPDSKYVNVRIEVNGIFEEARELAFWDICQECYPKFVLGMSKFIAIGQSESEEAEAEPAKTDNIKVIKCEWKFGVKEETERMDV